MELSRTLAQWIIHTRYEDIPEDVVQFTKLCILDWLGSALAGREQPPVKMIAQLVDEMGGLPQSHLVTGGKTSVLQASLVNAAASHIVELDDIHKASIIHAATVVIPAAISVAEWKQCSGQELITAIVVGYEVCYRIGEAVSPSHYHYWHNTATCGTFGAAAAAAKLLRLSEDDIVHALGSAGTQAAGLWEFIEDGAMSKQLHPAKAAYNGILSSLLAEKGFTAAKHILEGGRGFFQAMSTEFNSHKITDQLGDKYKIVENSFKIHASCRHTHTAIDLILDVIKDENIDIHEIDHIKVGTYETALAITDNPDPDTIYASKFSLQFCTALALVKGRAALEDFNNDSLNDPVIRDVMKKAVVFVHKAIDDSYPEKWGAMVEIQLKDGRHLLNQSDFPKGDPENPVSPEELQQKFKHILPVELRDSAADMITNVLNIDSAKQIQFLKEIG